MLTLLTIVCTVGGYAQETVTDELTATILNILAVTINLQHKHYRLVQVTMVLHMLVRVKTTTEFK